MGTELALSMYKAHPYFPLKCLGKKKCALYMTKYGIS